MKYTPSQILEITGLSRETLRYWRKILPPLEGKKGKAARYSAGDLLALLIINETINTLEMNVAVITNISQQIFEACQGVRWHQIRDKNLVIDIREKKVSIFSKNGTVHTSNGPIILLDIENQLNKLRDLLMADENIQFSLPFNPILVKRKSSSRM